LILRNFKNISYGWQDLLKLLPIGMLHLFRTTREGVYACACCKRKAKNQRKELLSI
jgi:hypothetical protein